MFNGTVTLTAPIEELTFERLTFTPPNKSAVEGIEIESDGSEVRITVSIRDTASRDEGVTLAKEEAEAALNRLSFHYDVEVGNAKFISEDLEPLHRDPMTMGPRAGAYTQEGRPISTPQLRQAANVRTLLEETEPRGEYCGLFRSALQSTGKVEQFLHLYHILLMLQEDRQAKVDAFIRLVSNRLGFTLPADTPSPHNGNNETVFTRLRNEFAHRRAGVDLAQTKNEMRDWVGSLAALTKEAIKQSP